MIKDHLIRVGKQPSFIAAKLGLCLFLLLGLLACSSEKPLTPQEAQLDLKIQPDLSGEARIGLIGRKGYAYPGLKPEEMEVYTSKKRQALALDEANYFDDYLKEYLRETTYTLSALLVTGVVTETWMIDTVFSGSFENIQSALALVKGRKAVHISHEGTRFSAKIDPLRDYPPSPPMRVRIQYPGKLIRSNATRQEGQPSWLSWDPSTMNKDGLELELELELAAEPAEK